jgi:2,3-bisphosphoglycerate-independent phosphoglycerate mutase
VSTDWTLHPHPHTPAASGPVVIAILDGVGAGPRDSANAVTQARTPNLDALRAAGLHGTLAAHGLAVGLPSDDDMGNSEVGHNALGAGRIFDQGATLVDRAFGDGSLFGGDVWRWVTQSGTLHLIGLLSDGNVHSHERHLHAMIQTASEQGVARLRVHPLLDGRDVDPTSALIYLDRLETILANAGAGAGRDYRIASGGGRMKVTMDRYEADWDMVDRGWKAHVLAQGRTFASAREAVETFRAEQSGIGDQFLPAFVVGPPEPMQDGDGVIFFNFRGDRAIEITKAFESAELAAFDRGKRPDVRYAGMMQYDGDLMLPTRFLVTPPEIDRTMGEYLVRNQQTIWACSETQKFGHVTYFWNGNRSGAFDDTLETYLEIRSDNIPFEQRPWMKAAEITDAALDAIKSGRYRSLRVNYANGDMVGHTGDLDATIVAVEAVDLCLARLWDAVKQANGALIVTADHGNADEMRKRDKKTGEPTSRVSTAHSLAPVPVMVWGAPTGTHLQSGGTLANIAATAFELMGFEAPEGYQPSLLVRD